VSYYFVAQIKINDDKEYQKYLDEASTVFRKFKGKYLSVDNSPVILEGKWNYTRNVLIEFETKQDFEDWYYSDEYQRILKLRLKAAHCDTLLLEGN
jgi:uncharacterized protein (DUF1330 family)